VWGEGVKKQAEKGEKGWKARDSFRFLGEKGGSGMKVDRRGRGLHRGQKDAE